MRGGLSTSAVLHGVFTVPKNKHNPCTTLILASLSTHPFSEVLSLHVELALICIAIVLSINHPVLMARVEVAGLYLTKPV